MKAKIFLSALGLLLPIAAMQGRALSPLTPDSVYLKTMDNPDGRGGLRFSWSADGNNWTAVADGWGFLASDFGVWGEGKRMYRPSLAKAADGSWVCRFFVDQNATTQGIAKSDNLTDWHVQNYYLVSKGQGELKFDSIAKVHSDLVRHLERYADHRRWLDTRWREHACDDATRFAGLQPVKATLSLDESQRHPISDKLIGIFFEDINYAADGGLYAELVRNRDFEFIPSERKGDAGWNALTAWSSPVAGKVLKTSTENPLHANNPHYLILDDGGALNDGFDGIPVKKGEIYDFSIAAIALDGRGGKLEAILTDSLGNTIGKGAVKVSGKGWKKMQCAIKATTDCPDARLLVRPASKGVRWGVDMVSLFPRDTYKGRKGGLRRDLAETLEALKPKFVRFPGGCVAHGNGIDNIYDWKGSIGPWEARRPLSNLWGYHQTRGLGYHEYFQLCEDLGAEPLPVVAAGVPCQNSSQWAHHSHDCLTGEGQQQGIPMEEMDAFVQDVLDLIEYANGDARTSEWGRKRAEAGHPRPFNLKYIGIGNEDLISDVFKERFKMIHDAVKTRYPEMTVVGTAGPFHEGADYTDGWVFAAQEKVDLVDEHYYVDPSWMIYNQHFYDGYDRQGPHVYLGEYAAHLPGRPSNLETALACALYLTGVERNGDVVELASYAPLLAKKGHTQWNPDLIYFTNTQVQPTADYQVQRLFGNHGGDEWLGANLAVDSSDSRVTARLGASAVHDTSSGDMIVKLVNLLPAGAEIDLQYPEWFDAASVECLQMSGDPADKDVVPVKVAADANARVVSLPAYSLTVLRYGKQEDSSKRNLRK